MSKSSPNFSLFIGKPVRDEYGRQIGRIASFAANPNGQVNGVFVQRVDGGFLRYRSKQFRMSGDDLVFLSPIKLKAKALCNEIPLIWRKNQALRELLEKKRISTETFNKLHSSFEDALNNLKRNADNILKEIEDQNVRSNKRVKDFNSALIHLEIEREIGRINGDSYQTAVKMIHNGLKQAEAEKSDLEITRSKLSNILLGETTTTVTQTEKEKEKVTLDSAATTRKPPFLPEPPVLIHVKRGKNQNS